MPKSVYDPGNRHQDLFAYADKYAGRLPATLVVAAADSKNKDRADYVCEGEGDQFTINAAVNSLPPGGGSVLLLEGSYSLDLYGVTATSNQYRIIEISRDNVAVKGQGQGTVLRLADQISAVDYSYHLLFIRAAGCRVSGLVLDGNAAHNGAGSVEGLRAGIAAPQCVLEGCLFRDCLYAGVNTQGDYTRISGNVFSHCGYGLYLGGGVDTVVNNQILDSASQGIHAEGGAHIIADNRILNSAEKGLYAFAVNKSQIRGNVLINQPVGLHLKSAQDSMVLDNLVRRFASGNSYAANEYSLYLESCSRLLAVGNWLAGKAAAVSGGGTIITAFSGTDWNIST